MRKITFFVQNNTAKLIAAAGLVVLYGILYKLLIHRLTAFGCMDDCNNFMGGYFLLHGKELFTQIFFNHAPFMAHLSAFIQYLTRPQNLYELILRHRQFLLIFGFVFELFLIFRFGWISLFFAIVYEVTKFYIGGDRFLAEPFIAYPMCYMIGLLFLQHTKKAIFRFDYLFAPICVWFVLFMREPYSLAALFFFFAFLVKKGPARQKIVSIITFSVLTLVTFFSYNPSEFFYNVVYVNKTNLAAENAETGFLGINLYKSFLYPIVIFFQGEYTFFRYVEMGASLLFLTAFTTLIWKHKWKLTFSIFLLLGLANIRFVVPGHVYYGAFHLLPWYAMTIFITVLMFSDIWNWRKVLTLAGFAGFCVIVFFVMLNRGSYVYDKIDEQTEFITNYGQVLQVGNVIASLSSPKDTLFVDGYDDMIYYVSHRYSSYQYSWFTSLMPQYKKYTDARLTMFKNNPPDFYYGSCPKQTAWYYLLPSFIKNSYVRLYNLKDPSCVWVRKDKLASITNTQWTKAGEFLYYQSPTNH